MAENQDESSGPAPGNEVPYGERFLSEEKQYPTKEERKKVLDEAKLPHVPPFITEPTPKPDWQPVPEPAPEQQTVEHVEAEGGAERFNRLVASAEETEKANQEHSQKLAKNIVSRYREKQDDYKIPQWAKEYKRTPQTPPPQNPFTPAPQSRPSETNLRRQIKQAPAREPKGGLGTFFRRLFKA